MDVGSVREWEAEANRQASGVDHNIVRFYNKEVHDKKQSEIDGRPRYKLIPYVEIFAPGQIRNTRIDRKATDDDKAKYRSQWERFQRNEVETLDGTHVEAWPYLNRAQVAEMKAIGFLTVEAIANASETGLQKMGMGARDLQKRAQQFLKPQSDTETELRGQVKAQTDRIKELEMKLEHLMAVIEAKPKRGRPPKVNHDAQDDLSVSA